MCSPVQFRRDSKPHFQPVPFITRRWCMGLWAWTWLRAVENWTERNIACIPHHIIWGWSDQGRRVGRDLWHSWKWRRIHGGFWAWKPEDKSKGKGKFHLQRPRRSRREVSCNCTLSLTSTLEGEGWSTPRPGRFNPRKETMYLSYRRLGGPQGRSGLVRKISPPPGFNSGPFIL